MNVIEDDFILKKVTYSFKIRKAPVMEPFLLIGTS